MTHGYTQDLPDSFFARLKAIAFMLRPTLPLLDEWLLAVMYSESGIHAHIGNSIGCVGLLQFCQTTAGYTREQIQAMDPTTQLDVVRAFVGNWAKHIESRGNVYQGNFLPGSFARGSGLGTVLAARDGQGYGGQEGGFYKANTLLDTNHDGKITVGDLDQRLTNIEHEPRFKEALARLRAAPHPARGVAGAVATVLFLAALGWGAVQAYHSPDVRRAVRDTATEVHALARRVS